MPISSRSVTSDELALSSRKNNVSVRPVSHSSDLIHERPPASKSEGPMADSRLLFHILRWKDSVSAPSGDREI